MHACRSGLVPCRRGGRVRLVLTDEEGAGFLPGMHEPGCMCCAGRSDAAMALAGLFRERALGREFSGVLAVVGDAGAADVRAALVADPFVSGRFRLA